MLGTATEKIGKGDFKYKIGFRQKDEFGILAHTFNKMANRLYHTTASVELLENEINERKQVEEEREKLIKKLQKASANIKTLSSLLPICSKCKKIRDDKGYWNNLEGYIQTHWEFSKFCIIG